MRPKDLTMVMSGDHGSHIRPFLWYSKESKELVGQEIRAIHDSGAKEFVFENRGGDWFATDFWWDMFGYVLETARSLDMRVWCVDDSHVNTGSANDSMTREENACYRSKNLRLDALDITGPFASGAVFLPNHKAEEKIVRIVAFRRDMDSGISCGDGVDLTANVKDGLCMVDLPEGIWRIYFVMTAASDRHGIFDNYITMVSKESCRHLIDEVHEKMYEHFKEYFGNTFAGFFSDEPAFGNCNGEYGAYSFNLRLGQLERDYPWWDDFPARLAEKCGISEEEVMEKLPALWDEMENGTALRYAYMDMVSDLWKENFSCQLGKWCEDHNVEYIGHNLEDSNSHMRTGWGCGHYFRSMAGQHMSGMDVVFEQLVPGIAAQPHAMNNCSKVRDGKFYHYTLPKLAASLAHITPEMQNRALCEIFGAAGWTCGISTMRAWFNICLSSGINNFVPHAYAMALPKVFEDKQIRDALEDSYTPPGYVMTYLPPTFYSGGYNPQYPVFCDIIRYAQRISHLTENGTHRPDVAVYYNAECDWMNDGEYLSLDDVTESVIMGGYDLEILPLDTLCSAAQVKDGRLNVSKESYGALILPGGETMAEAILLQAKEFAAAGLPVIFAGMLPVKTEKGVLEAGELSGFTAVPVKELAAYLQDICPPQFVVDRRLPGLRHYLFTGSDGKQRAILYNSTLEDIDFVLDGTYLIYDPWKNIVMRSNSEKRIFLPSQYLLIIFFDADADDVPEYILPPAKLEVLPLTFDIYARNSKETEFILLHKASPAVNLNAAGDLLRFCGEFRYEAEFECSDTGLSQLVIPCAGDCAQLLLNGKDCGTEAGKVCRFDIRGKLEPGKNKLVIRTFDSPVYADREADGSTAFGSGLPLPQHGFTGDVLIG